MLKLNQISKTFDQTIALHPLDISFDKAKTTVLIGPSGCGKSTLLRLIIGLIKPDQGNIEFDGNIFDESGILSIRHKMGYVIQEGGLFPHITAYKNISLLANYLKLEKSDIQKRIFELSELTQFSKDLLDQFPIQLSGGQRQRVSLMRALMLDPELLLLDEPLGALDPMIRAELQTDLKHIFKTLNKTVIMVTHDMGEAAYFGDDIILLRDGQIVIHGSIKELMNCKDPFVKKFINAQRNPLDDIKDDLK